jgi:hypothetical protein
MNIWRCIDTDQQAGVVPFAISLFSSLLSFLGGTIFFHGAVGVGANIAVVAWIG